MPTVVHVRAPRQPKRGRDDDEVQGVKGSTRLEAKRQRRRDGRDGGRKRPTIISESEFLARREAVERVMVVRESADRTQIAVLEDGGFLSAFRLAMLLIAVLAAGLFALHLAMPDERARTAAAI